MQAFMDYQKREEQEQKIGRDVIIRVNNTSFS